MDRDRLVRWTARVAEVARTGTRLIDVLRNPNVTDDRELCLAAHLACFTFDGEHLPGAREHALAFATERGNSEDRIILSEIDRLGRLYAPTSFVEPSRAHVENAFRDFAAARGIEILRVLQTGSEGREIRMWVFLGIGPDGIAKVWKEIDERAFDSNRWRLSLPTEDVLFNRVGNVPGLVRCWGVEDLGDVRFLRKEFLYGQSLSDFVDDGRRPAEGEARRMIGEIARVIAGLHARGVVIGDLHPKNVRIGTDGRPMLFDLGLGYALGDDALSDHDAFVTVPRYLAPEMLWKHRLGRHTEVFQLGAMYLHLLQGENSEEIRFPEDPQSFLSTVFAHGLASALLPYEGNDPFLRRMLDFEPARRPSMEEVAAAFATNERVFIAHPARQEEPVKRSRDTVLIPARIGIPHKGHVDLIARCIDLGYRALISLHLAYTITKDDPYPKWDVMKMVARSLMRLGYRPGIDFVFTFTRLYESDPEQRLHFAMLPEFERVAALGSGNPDAHHLMACPVFDQRMLFGEEGAEYETRSWGDRLRRAIREGDRKTFDAFVACGVEDVMSFDELRASYARVPVEFVPRFERFILENAEGDEIVRGRVRRYGTVDEHVIGRLVDDGHVATTTDPYARHTEVVIDGQSGTLHYHDGMLQSDGILVIRITFVPS